LKQWNGDFAATFFEISLFFNRKRNLLPPFLCSGRTSTFGALTPFLEARGLLLLGRSCCVRDLELENVKTPSRWEALSELEKVKALGSWILAFSTSPVFLWLLRKCLVAKPVDPATATTKRRGHIQKKTKSKRREFQLSLSKSLMITNLRDRVGWFRLQVFKIKSVLLKLWYHVRHVLPAPFHICVSLPM